MKRTLKAAFAAALALCMALALTPFSSLPRFDVKAVVRPSWTVPAGYNAHDYNKCVIFLEQTNENGVKNGEKLSASYDPNDPATWGSDYYGALFQWTSVNGELRLLKIYVYAYGLVGGLNVSGCTALEYLECSSNSLTELDVSGCTALETLSCSYNDSLTELNVSGCTALYELYCYSNSLTELNVSGCTALYCLSCSNNSLTELDVSGCTALKRLYCDYNSLAELNVSGCTALETLYCDYNSLAELNVSGCTALEWLYCYDNSLAELDVSGCTALRGLSCSNNELTALELSQNPALVMVGCSNNILTELDVSNNPALEALYCQGNMLTELDLSANPRLMFDNYTAAGNGLIGYSSYVDDKDEWFVDACLYAVPKEGASFEGFYYESGELYSEGEWSDYYEAYVCFRYANIESILTDRIVARFSGGAVVPGDLNGNGSVTLEDSILALRLTLGLIDGSGINPAAADMDGNGSVTLQDAILVLRTMLGLA